jgi:DNA-binding response OmpR family regulator
VLVIEDDPVLLRTLSYNLERANYRVVTARSGEAGLDLARREGDGIDLVVLDLMLPGMTGFQVLPHLRTFSNVPVLILSARGEEEDKIDGLELGADDYITKPFALQELLARIRAALRRRAAPALRPAATLLRGPLRIEPDRHRALVGDVELRLRPKEFQLLVAMAMEPARLFRRRELLDLVWGAEVIVDPRTVDVHVSWLRGKLAAAGAPADLIRTVHGAGYRFVTPDASAEDNPAPD